MPARSGPVSRLHVFDMDGTLLHGSACLEVSRHLGQLEAILVIEDAWGRGEVGHVEFYELCLPLWTGLTDELIGDIFTATPWLAGVREVLADIAARGEHSAVISLSPQFFVDRLLPWGLTRAYGAAVRPGVPVDPARVLTPASKVGLVQALLAEFGLAAVDCVAYGDSSSDVPLFEVLANTVSVNGNPTLHALARAHYEGSDLRGAYALGRALFAGGPSQPASDQAQVPG